MRSARNAWADLAGERDAHDRGLQAIATAHGDGQVLAARHGVAMAMPFIARLFPYAQRCGNIFVESTSKRKRIARLALGGAFGLEGEDGSELVVA